MDKGIDCVFIRHLARSRMTLSEVSKADFLKSLFVKSESVIWESHVDNRLENIFCVDLARSALPLPYTSDQTNILQLPEDFDCLLVPAVQQFHSFLHRIEYRTAPIRLRIIKTVCQFLPVTDHSV